MICAVLTTVAPSCKSSKNAASGKKAEDAKSLRSTEEEIAFGRKFVDGCSARMKGNLEEALKLFTECAAIDPANVPLKYELGFIYKLLGVNDKALQFAKQAASANEQNEYYQMLLIDCYNVLRMYSQSVKLREGLVKNFPGRSEFKEDLAIQYSVMGYYEKAFRLYDELEKQYGINEQISLNKTKLLKSLKKNREAEEELLRLSASNKTEPRYYSYLADFYIEQNEMEKAKKMYDKILEIDPGNPVVNLALHDYYSSQGQSAEAFEYLKKAFMNPDLDVLTKENILVSFYRKSEDPSLKEKGFALAKIMVQIHPLSSEANAAYGDYLLLENRLKDAWAYFYRAAISEKSNARNWEQLLKADYELQKTDSLEKHSAKAMELFPNQANFYFYNGMSNMQLRNYKKAALAFKDGLEFVVDNRSQMIDFYSGLGDAYNYDGEFEKSDKAFDDALKIDADNTFVLNQYAYYLSLRKVNLDKAEKLSKKANSLQPGNRSYMDTYGWILYQQKKYTEAEEWLAAAAKMGANKPDILEHYGDLLFKLGQINEAVKQWEKAKSAGGNAERLTKKIKEKKTND